MKPIATGILIVLLVHGGAAAQTAGEQAAIVRDFQQRLVVYTQQHQGLDLFPDVVPAATPAPNIFTPPVAMVFRQMIARALAEGGGAAALRSVTALDHLAVLEPFPATRLYEFPHVLADALPLLPEPLEYRLTDHDLVVRDRETNRVVGVLREAVGTAYLAVR
jgi:hypothetical protein